MSSCSSQPDYEVGYLTKGNPDNSYLDSCKTYCCGDQMEKEYKTYDQPEDIYKEQWFKDMPWYKRAWMRFIIAFFETISMH